MKVGIYDMESGVFAGAIISAPASFWSKALGKTVDECREMYCWGCGPGKDGDKAIPDSLLGVSVWGACAVHDEMCFIGGSEKDRCYANDVFHWNMDAIINANSANWFMKKARLFIADLYFDAVAIAGMHYFNYHS